MFSSAHIKVTSFLMNQTIVNHFMLCYISALLTVANILITEYTRCEVTVTKNAGIQNK